MFSDAGVGRFFSLKISIPKRKGVCTQTGSFFFKAENAVLKQLKTSVIFTLTVEYPRVAVIFGNPKDLTFGVHLPDLSPHQHPTGLP